jgi:hypothetical protein
MTCRIAIVALLMLSLLTVAATPAHAQTRDSLLNGAVIGGAIGAGAGVAFTHAVRDSDLVFSQYLSGAVIFAAIGAGAGLGIDALFSRNAAAPGVAHPSRFRIIPVVGPRVRLTALQWRW